jgi:sec-independent protein translocase protein TatA
MFGNPMEILIIASAAIVLFGADKIPKLARGLGQAKAEFVAGQTEASTRPPETIPDKPKETTPGASP